MKPILVAAVLATGCGAGSDARAPEPLSGLRSGLSSPEPQQQSPSYCSFKRSARCGSTDCCEFASTAYPGYREEYVCCGGVSAFVDRICSGSCVGCGTPNGPADPAGCPDCKTPCGPAGPGGCAICQPTIAFSMSCNVHPQEQPGEPHACGYVLDGD